MRVFLTGANGWIGSVIARGLRDGGHSVVGLVRSKEKAEALSAAGITPLVGGLGDLDVLRAGARESDGIIHTAFGLDLSKMAEIAEEERLALEAFGEVYAGSNRPIIVTSGVFLTPPGEVFREDARPPVAPELPRASEQTAFALADRGVCASVVRNAAGSGDVSALYEDIARIGVVGEPPPEEGWRMVNRPAEQLEPRVAKPRLKPELPRGPFRRRPDEREHGRADEEHLAPEDLGRVHNGEAGT